MDQNDITAAENAGVDLTEPIFEDYFGFAETHAFNLPDGRQRIYFRTMSEGDKSKFQKSTSRDITLQRNTGDARISANPAEERHALLLTCVVDWEMYRPKAGAQPPFTADKVERVPFSSANTSRGPGEFEKWLDKANPKLVEDLEFEIRKKNPWLLGEMTVKDIDDQITHLEEQRKTALEREQGEGTSGGK